MPVDLPGSTAGMGVLPRHFPFYTSITQSWARPLASLA